MTSLPYLNIPRLKTLTDFQAYLEKIQVDMPVDEQLKVGSESPLAQTYQLPNGKIIGNRFCINPMEGWDAETDGNPSELTKRRWLNFGRSGAKFIWGGEAAAVRPDGRANPNQLMILDNTMAEVEKMRLALVEEHDNYYGQTDDLFVGLQLTHSGRFCRPNQKAKLEPKIVYHHPLIDDLFHIEPEYLVLTDMEIDDLVGYYVLAAKRAQTIGFEFVDIKHCHGYLGHEFLSAVTRPGRYGGSLENRTRFLRQIVEGIQTECPDLLIGVRVSMFDMPPFRPDDDNIGRMLSYRNENDQYPYAFCGDPDNPGEIKLDEMIQLMDLMNQWGVSLINFTAGSPYYNPHLTRPAYFPPSDGYKMPEDPLEGVARHIHVGAELNKHSGKLITVGSAYTYLQDYLPNVAHAVIDRKMIDFIGLGRMVLSYPEMPADIIMGNSLKRNRICRTFSDCTTAPRMGLVSGCYPLDHFYKDLPEAVTLKELKRRN
jgi:2,4-dienoyl-CoA reductase-like NADH-dependent reductase (Old Yellow Enzyme family)